ncbi:MAG: hypothetical protein JWN48_4921, partial [Myxococcaceae bacterium]|nr:hypothetical protein [Myxococcaceae bacterium]
MQLTRFEDVQRPLAQFVRLLGQPATVAVHAAPAGVRRAFANEHGLFFPDSFPMLSGEPGRAVYYAAAAHLVAHSRFGGARWQRGSLRAVQVVLVSLLEDARVERRLAAELPGLLPLWRRYHTAAALEQVTFPALCARLSCALSDPGYRDEHPIIVKARLLVEQSGALWSAEDCRRIGSLLGNDVGQTRLSFSEREYLVEPVYRDDHRLLWEEPVSETQPSHEHAEPLERARATAKTQPRAAALERASEPPLQFDGSGEGPQAEGAATAAPVVVSAPVLARYPEYDYLLGLSRPAFCTVREQAQASGPTLSGAPPQRPRRRLPAELQRLAGALRLQTRRRRGRERDGDGIDLDQALEARIDVLAQQTPDERVYVRTAQRRQKLALLVLLDLSASTAARVPNSETTLLELSREACLLLGDVLTHVGDALAIHGFSSNGRHEVEYHRFKDFSEPWNAATEA